MAKTKRRRNQIIIDTIGHNVRKFREEKGMTIVELAFLMNVQPKQVSVLELGEGNPTATTIALAAENLGVDPGRLFDKV